VEFSNAHLDDDHPLTKDHLAPQTQFHDRIAQLVYTFPEDAVTSTGAPFWSAPKRFPHALTFDAADPSQARAPSGRLSHSGMLQQPICCA